MQPERESEQDEQNACPYNTSIILHLEGSQIYLPMLYLIHSHKAKKNVMFPPGLVIWYRPIMVKIGKTDDKTKFTHYMFVPICNGKDRMQKRIKTVVIITHKLCDCHLSNHLIFSIFSF